MNISSISMHQHMHALSLEMFCPRFFRNCCCHSCGNRTLYWHINVRKYYLQKGACKYIVQCHVQCHVPDFLGQTISQPNRTLPKLEPYGKKQKRFPKHYKRKQITNWWHIPKNPGHKNVHCHPWKKKLSAWAVLEPRPLALEPMALPLSYCTWLRACSLQTTNITLISPFQFF